MVIDPRVGFYFSLIAAIVTAIAAGGATLTDIFNPQTAKIVVGTAAFLGSIISAINALLHAMPATANVNPDVADKFPLGPKA